MGDVVLDFLLFLLQLVVVCFWFLLLVTIRDNEVNVLLLALFEFEEVGLFSFDKVQNRAVLNFQQARELSKKISLFQTQEKLFLLVGLVYFRIRQQVLNLLTELIHILFEFSISGIELIFVELEILCIMGEKESINIANDFNGLEWFELFILSDFVEDNR